jgi:restriction endonuclease S subunit
MYNLKSVKKDLSLNYDFKYLNKEIEIADRYKCNEGDLLMAITDLTPASEIIGRTTIVNQEGVFSMDLVKLKINQSICFPKYLHYLLNSEKFLSEARKFSIGNNVKHLNLENVLSIQIPLPYVTEQQKIVDELNSYQKIIDGAKQIVDNWKPAIDINPNWEVVKIGDVCEIRPKKPKLDANLKVSFIDMATMPINGYKFLHKEIKKVSDVEKGYTYFAENDVLLAKITPCFENGKCGIATLLKNKIGFGSTEFIVFRCNNDILPEYLYLNISDYNFRITGENFMSGTAGQQRLSLDFVKNYQFALPPLHIQQEIVGQLETERKMIESQKEIIAIFGAPGKAWCF